MTYASRVARAGAGQLQETVGLAGVRRQLERGPDRHDRRLRPPLSRAPEKLPKSVTGDGKYTPRGTMRLLLRFYSPYAGGFTSVKVNGKVVATLYNGGSSAMTNEAAAKAGDLQDPPGLKGGPDLAQWRGGCRQRR